jgi:hypothetical protein
MAESALEFVTQSYRLINASNPTVPLHGNDFQQGLLILNKLLDYYCSTGLMITIAQEVNIPLAIGQGLLTVGPATFLPVPDITLGRMANLTAAWLLLDGVTYPLIDKSRDEFLASFKYSPLQGLPRFIIVYQNVQTTTLQLYPAPSQYFQFYLRAKFEAPAITAASDMSSLPLYYSLFFSFEVAKYMAMYKGRAAAWTPELEAMRVEAKNMMEASSEVNLSITGDRASLLNGSWRVRAGI